MIRWKPVFKVFNKSSSVQLWFMSNKNEFACCKSRICQQHPSPTLIQNCAKRNLNFKITLFLLTDSLLLWLGPLKWLSEVYSWSFKLGTKDLYHRQITGSSLQIDNNICYANNFFMNPVFPPFLALTQDLRLKFIEWTKDLTQKLFR